jgi:hypothetical protein
MARTPYRIELSEREQRELRRRARQQTRAYMDVPTRQAYVAAVVDPHERTAAAAYTNSARNAVRPVAPLLAGPSLRIGLGAPFLIAGALKSVYDIGLYLLFRNVRERQPKFRPTSRGARAGAHQR